MQIVVVLLILEKLEDEGNDVEIYVNPGDKAGFIFSLALMRMAYKIAIDVNDFADVFMQKGLDIKSLTAKMFERFDLRNAEITLADGTKLTGEVETVSFGDEPNAHYELTKSNGKKFEIYRKDIAFIKEI